MEIISSERFPLERTKTVRYSLDSVHYPNTYVHDEFIETREMIRETRGCHRYLIFNGPIHVTRRRNLLLAKASTMRFRENLYRRLRASSQSARKRSVGKSIFYFIITYSSMATRIVAANV